MFISLFYSSQNNSSSFLNGIGKAVVRIRQRWYGVGMDSTGRCSWPSSWPVSTGSPAPFRTEQSIYGYKSHNKPYWQNVPSRKPGACIKEIALDCGPQFCWPPLYLSICQFQGTKYWGTKLLASKVFRYLQWTLFPFNVQKYNQSLRILWIYLSMFPFVIIQQHFKQHTFCVPSQALIDLQGYTVLWYSMGAQDHPLFLMSQSHVSCLLCEVCFTKFHCCPVIFDFYLKLCLTVCHWQFTGLPWSYLNL